MAASRISSRNSSRNIAFPAPIKLGKGLVPLKTTTRRTGQVGRQRIRISSRNSSRNIAFPAPTKLGSRYPEDVRKSLFWARAIAIAAIGVLAANAQAQRGPADPQMRGDGPPPEARPFSITRADPALDQIISPDARLVELAHGFGLTEAGLWIADGQSGSWIFGGLLDNVLYRVNPQGQVSVFMEKAGYSGNVRTMSARRLALDAVMCCSSGRPAREWITKVV